jgi:hypothetical protein
MPISHAIPVIPPPPSTRAFDVIRPLYPASGPDRRSLAA